MKTFLFAMAVVWGAVGLAPGAEARNDQTARERARVEGTERRAVDRARESGRGFRVGRRDDRRRDRVERAREDDGREGRERSRDARRR
jgi:hypothetical protein